MPSKSYTVGLSRGSFVKHHLMTLLSYFLYIEGKDFILPYLTLFPISKRLFP